MYYEDYSIDILYGGVIQWCEQFNGEWSLTLLYYTVKLIERFQIQIERLTILFYSSGFVSFSRGLHFRYCRRWRNNTAV